MRLGFDIDGVVNNLSASLAEYANNKYDIKINDEAFVGYWIEDSTFSEDSRLNKTIIDGLVNVVCDIDFQVKCKPYEEAVVALNKLKRAGHTLHFLTNRNTGKDNEYKTAVWLKQNGVRFDSLNHCGTSERKGLLGRALNLDFYLDDYEGNLEVMYTYKKRWTKGLGLFTQPWNRDSIDASKFIRLNNWNEIIRHLGIHKNITGSRRR